MPPHKLKYTECIKTNIIKSHNYSTEIEKKQLPEHETCHEPSTPVIKHR